MKDVADFARKHGSLTVHLVNVQPKPQERQTHGMEPEAILMGARGVTIETAFMRERACPRLRFVPRAEPRR